MRILLIEDDQQLAQLIERQLRREGHSTDIAYDGETGLAFALRDAHDLFIVDWMLPERDGPSICRAARAAHLTQPILMLTARSQIEDRVSGLDSGADDYLAKPFAFQELLARVRAMGRRAAGALADGDTLRCGDIGMDLRAHTATRGNTPLSLTITEWKLLEFLMRHQGQVLTRQQLLDAVWTFERDVQPKMVDIYISYLRRALNVHGSGSGSESSDPIQAVRGVGYRMVAPSEAASTGAAPSEAV